MTIEIQVFNNGPYLVKGDDIVIKDADGKPWDTEGKDAVALCRCGASANKPFCDGTHKAAGFEDASSAG
jgi:CDGSH-type Zn-finger protein